VTLNRQTAWFVTRPSGFVVAGEQDLVETIQAKIAACQQQQLFADPPVTEVTWAPKARASARTRRDEDTDSDDEDGKE
jgi:hypothetical protein